MHNLSCTSKNAENQVCERQACQCSCHKYYFFSLNDQIRKKQGIKSMNPSFHIPISFGKVDSSERQWKIGVDLPYRENHSKELHCHWCKDRHQYSIQSKYQYWMGKIHNIKVVCIVSFKIWNVNYTYIYIYDIDLIATWMSPQARQLAIGQWKSQSWQC